MPFLTNAAFTPLMVDGDLCAYLRHKGNQRLLVAINRAYHPKTLTLPPKFAAAQPQVLLGDFQEGKLAPESAVIFFAGDASPDAL